MMGHYAEQSQPEVRMNYIPNIDVRIFRRLDQLNGRVQGSIHKFVYIDCPKQQHDECHSKLCLFTSLFHLGGGFSE